MNRARPCSLTTVKLTNLTLQVIPHIIEMGYSKEDATEALRINANQAESAVGDHHCVLLLIA